MQCVCRWDIVYSADHGAQEVHKGPGGSPRKQNAPGDVVKQEQFFKGVEVDRQSSGWSILAITMEQNSIGYSPFLNWQELRD